MKITRLVAHWDNGATFSLNEDAITTLLQAGDNQNIQNYLLLAFVTNLKGGLPWKPLTSQLPSICTQEHGCQ